MTATAVAPVTGLGAEERKGPQTVWAVDSDDEGKDAATRNAVESDRRGGTLPATRFESSWARAAYCFDRSEIADAEWAEHCRRLTVGKPPQRMWLESVPTDAKERPQCRVPVAYGLRHFGPPARDLRWTGAAGGVIDKGFQIPAERVTISNAPDRLGRVGLPPWHAPAHEVVDRRLESRLCGGTISADCGYGLSSLVLGQIARRRMRALVLVHSRTCVAAWQQNVKRTLPELRVATVWCTGDLTKPAVRAAADSCDVLFLLAAVRPHCPDELMSRFGTVYIDDVHTLHGRGLQTVAAWPARTFIGTSSSLCRSDRGHLALKLLIGTSLFAAPSPSRGPSSAPTVPVPVPVNPLER